MNSSTLAKPQDTKKRFKVLPAGITRKVRLDAGAARGANPCWLVDEEGSDTQVYSEVHFEGPTYTQADETSESYCGVTQRTIVAWIETTGPLRVR